MKCIITLTNLTKYIHVLFFSFQIIDKRIENVKSQQQQQQNVRVFVVNHRTDLLNMSTNSKLSEKQEHAGREEVNGLFPPIASPRKHVLRSNSSSNDSDTVEAPEVLPLSSRDTSPSKSPCKLPSLSSQSNSTPQTRERKHRRKKLCRSPSYPPTRPKTNDFDSPLPNEKNLVNLHSNEYLPEYDVKLPNIFKNSTGMGVSPETTSLGWTVKDRSRTKANLRRTESTRENYVGSPTMESKYNKNQQRAHTHAALLLPLRTQDSRKPNQSKKKKAFTRQSSYTEGQTLSLTIDNETGATNGWGADYDSDYYDSSGQHSGSSFDRILEETDSHMSIPSAGGSHISVPSASKQWLKSKEGQVKV